MKPFTGSERRGILIITGIALCIVGIGGWLRLHPARLPEKSNTPEIETIYVDSIALLKEARRDSIRMLKQNKSLRNGNKDKKKSADKQNKGKKKVKKDKKKESEPKKIRNHLDEHISVTSDN